MRDLAGPRVTLATATILLCTTLLWVGCATQAVWRKWSVREEISSIGLEVQTSTPRQVEIGWRARIAAQPDLAGRVTIDPELEDCHIVEVLVARRTEEPARIGPREKHFAVDALTTSLPVEAIWAAVGDRTCTLLLVFRKVAEPNTLAVTASWQSRADVSVESIGAPRQAAWLTLLPVSVLADTASAITIVPIVICLSMGDDCGRLLTGVASDAH
jgi:hypothetical protein